MPDRMNSLDVVAASIGGTDWKDRVKTMQISTGVTYKDGRAVIDRHENAIPTKQHLRFSSMMMRGAKTARETALHVTAYSIGGTSYLGDLISGRLRVTNTLAEGSGCSDEWKYPNPTATDIEMTAKLKVPSTVTPALMTLIHGAISGLDVQVSFTINAQVITIDALLTANNVSVNQGDDSVLDVTLRGRVDGSAPTVAGQALLVDALTGDAVVAYNLDVAFGDWAGNAVVSSAELAWDDEGLIEESFEFENQGTPTFTPNV